MISKYDARLPRHSLLTICKLSVRPKLTMELSHMTNLTMLHSARKLKASKHAWLLLGQSKVHHETKGMKNWVSSNCLNLGKKIQKFCMLYEIIKFEISKYLNNIISLSNHQHNTGSKNLSKTLYCRIDSFRYLYFLMQYLNDLMPHQVFFINRHYLHLKIPY